MVQTRASRSSLEQSKVKGIPLDTGSKSCVKNVNAAHSEKSTFEPQPQSSPDSQEGVISSQECVLSSQEYVIPSPSQECVISSQECVISSQGCVISSQDSVLLPQLQNPVTPTQESLIPSHESVTSSHLQSPKSVTSSQEPVIAQQSQESAVQLPKLVAASQVDGTRVCVVVEVHAQRDPLTSSSVTNSKATEVCSPNSGNMRKRRKRKVISPLSDVMSFDMDLDASPSSTGSFNLSSIEASQELSETDEKIKTKVVEVMASWMGQMHHTMQNSLNMQLDKVVEQMRSELREEMREELCADMKEKIRADLRQEMQEEVHQQVSADDVISSIDHTSKLVEDVEQWNGTLQSKCMVLEGRLIRAEKEIHHLREELLKQESRSMKDNLMFHNVPETRSENTEQTLRNFLKKEMKISDENLRKIRFDRVHRVGRQQGDGHRVIVAKFNPFEGRQIVLQHIKKVDKSKRYGLNEQLPRELAERE